jgi:CRP-like cAMP-binding protein
MSVNAQLHILSHLIEGLPSRQRQQLLSRCESVDLVFGNVLHEANQPIRHVYFPLSGFISQVTALPGHLPLEMGLIGNEGVLGASLALGVSRAPMRAVVQGSGSALRISSGVFKQELRKSPALLRSLKRYLYVLMAQLSQSTACIHFHAIEPRLARWLLLTHDCAHADHFHLTHEFLAGMLGVRRSSVSIAAAALQARGLISYKRGEIKILDRVGLEQAACECYAVLVADYRAQF